MIDLRIEITRRGFGVRNATRCEQPGKRRRRSFVAEL